MHCKAGSHFNLWTPHADTVPGHGNTLNGACMPRGQRSQKALAQGLPCAKRFRCADLGGGAGGAGGRVRPASAGQGKNTMC